MTVQLGPPLGTHYTMFGRIADNVGVEFDWHPNGDKYIQAHERLWRSKLVCVAYDGRPASQTRYFWDEEKLKRTDEIYGSAEADDLIDEAIYDCMCVLTGQRLHPLRLVSVALAPYSVGPISYVVVTVIAEEYPRFQRRFASWRRKE